MMEDSQFEFKYFSFQTKTERISEPDLASQTYQTVGELFADSATALVPSPPKKRGRPPLKRNQKMSQPMAQNAQKEEFTPQIDAKGSLKLCSGDS